MSRTMKMFPRYRPKREGGVPTQEPPQDAKMYAVTVNGDRWVIRAPSSHEAIYWTVARSEYADGDGYRVQVNEIRHPVPSPSFLDALDRALRSGSPVRVHNGTKGGRKLRMG